MFQRSAAQMGICCVAGSIDKASDGSHPVRSLDVSDIRRIHTDIFRCTTLTMHELEWSVILEEEYERCLQAVARRALLAVEDGGFEIGMDPIIGLWPLPTSWS